MTPLEVIGQGPDGPLPPGRGGDLVADVFAELPVEVDEGRVHGGEGPRLRGVDQGQHLVEFGLRRCRGFGSLDGSRARSFLGRLAHDGSSDWASRAARS